MRWLYALRARIVLLRRSAAEKRMEEEFRLHLEMETARRIREGASPEEAERHARIAFGGADVHREAMRDGRGARWLEELLRDVRFGARSLARRPGYAAVALGTLALGIGANTAVFSVVKGVLFRPLPYDQPERVVQLNGRFPGIGFESANISAAELADVRRRLPRAFEAVSAYRSAGGTLGGAGEPEHVDVLEVTPSFFGVLRVPAQRGRVLAQEESARGRDGVIVLGARFWRLHLGADPTIVGRTLQLDGRARVVAGVMPDRFNFEKADAYIPLADDDSLELHRGWHNYTGLARLRPGVTVEGANTELGALAAELAREHPQSYPPELRFGLRVRPLREVLVGNVQRSLLVLLSVVALVLLMACINLAMLTLARAESRGHELAVRLAMGARRGRLVRQLLTESTLLALVGGALGVPLAAALQCAFLAVSAGSVPRADDVHLDGGVLLVTLGVTLITGVVFGVLPALQSTRPDLQASLREGGTRGWGSPERQRTRGLLIVAEVALAIVVLAAAGLLTRSFWRLVHVDMGVRTERVALMHLSLPAAQYADSAAPARFYQQLVERIGALPGVEHAAAAWSLPTMGWSNWDIEIEGAPARAGAANPAPMAQIVTPSYFATLAIPVVAGRALNASDDGREGVTIVVNRTMARQLFPGGAVGRRFRFAGATPPMPWMTIVGVVGDIRMGGPGEPPTPQWTMTTESAARLGPAPRDMWMVARTATDPGAIMGPARRALAAADPRLAFSSAQTMEHLVSYAVARPRFTMLLLGAFALLALMLAALGVYGVLAYTVAERTRELGIRLALGATPTDLVRMVLRQAAALSAVGVAIGLAGALLAGRLVQGLLFQVPARDPLTLGAVTLLLLLVAFLSALIPARRATRLDPLIALRAG